ncbi:Rap1a/Tai family immunity protein [Sphingopyxis fribergensis]
MKRFVALALLAGMAPADGVAFQPRESLAGGNSYYSQCVASAKDYSACIGYFMGIADAPVMNAEKSPDEAVYCLPAGATYEQNRDVFHKYLRDNPQKLHVSTHLLFLMAMNASYPCKRSPTLAVDPATGEVFMSAPKPQ